eukprot:COSAG02_NODE_2154_length_9654_cov_5.613919_1_plen_65_part_00
MTRREKIEFKDHGGPPIRGYIEYSFGSRISSWEFAAQPTSTGGGRTRTITGVRIGPQIGNQTDA